ncbi:DNA topoisomerase [Ruminococcus albus]|uniref:DNA topoisomerase n=1 Tax=Ruminococcus albus TaxID=1264 RepID=A0A1I1GSL6_RUMAL|nr:DNA topoisomerase [Ruminococcus albus]
MFTDGTHEFKIKGDTPLTPSFRRYEPKKSDENDDDSKTLPSFSQGELVSFTWVIDNKMTKAPPRYTIDSLNAYLKAPFAKSSSAQDNDDSPADDSELYEAVKKAWRLAPLQRGQDLSLNA